MKGSFKVGLVGKTLVEALFMELKRFTVRIQSLLILYFLPTLLKRPKLIKRPGIVDVEHTF